jgi:hypothetical protein
VGCGCADTIWGPANSVTRIAVYPAQRDIGIVIMGHLNGLQENLRTNMPPISPNANRPARMVTIAFPYRQRPQLSSLRQIFRLFSRSDEHAEQHQRVADEMKQLQLPMARTELNTNDVRMTAMRTD